MIVNLKESQIDGLIKLVLAEERTKKGLIEQWERAPAGKPKDALGYWKILFTNLTAGGIGVKWQVPNDPVKSTFMYWGGWIIWKDIKKNGGYPVSFGTGKDGLTFAFYPKGKYAGQPLNNIELMASKKNIPVFKLDKYAKKSTKEVTDEFKKLLGNSKIKNFVGNIGKELSAVWSDLYTKLNQYKPSTVKLVKSNSGDAYFLTNYFGSTQLGFYTNGDIKLYDGTRWTSIGKWDSSMQKDGKLSGGWLSRNNGEKVSLGPALNEPNLMPISWMLASSWNKKSTTTTTKSKNYPYEELKNNPTPEFIAKVIKESRGTVQDNEAWAESAFMAIKNMAMYDKVAKALGTDPYKFVKSFITVSIKYHVQAIQVSYLQLLNDEKPITVTKFSTQCPLTFTEQNPGGGKTNKSGQVPYALWNTNKDPYLKVVGAFSEYKGVVPGDFGWKLNNNIYPYPTLYSKSCTLGTNLNESKIYEQVNFDRFNKSPQLQTIDIRQVNPSARKVSINTKNQKKMIEFNNALVQQNKLIPQYCQKPLRREKRVARGGNDPKIIDAYLSMYTLCKDFGGLWVRGANTANFTCGCRDMNAIDLNVAVDDGSGFKNRMGQTISQSVDKTQTSKNWSDAENQQLALNALALASAFIPVVGPAISAGISLAGAYGQYRQGNNKAAAIELFFAVLPFIGKIPGMAKVSKTMAGSLKVKLVRGGTMTLTEFNTVKQIIAYDTYISSKVGQYLKKQAMSDVSKTLLTTAVKKVEQKVVGLAGTPTYGDLKKKATGETLAVTTGVEDKNT
jgi:hypothetical protein